MLSKQLWRLALAASLIGTFALALMGCQPAAEPAAQAATAEPTAVPPTAVPPTEAPTATAVSLPDPGTIIWTAETAASIYSSPLVVDDLVYFGSDDYSFRAVDRLTGQTVWEFETGDRVRGRPYFADGLIYFTGDDGSVYALNAQTGDEVWATNIHNDVIKRGTQSLDYQQSSPTVADGVLYTGSADGSLYALNAQTGEEVWQFATEGIIRSSPTVSDGVVYVGSWDNHLYAIDAATGAEVWRFNAESIIQSTPTVADGMVFIGSRASNLYAVDAATGAEVWRFPYGGSWVESSATVVDDVIYIGSSDAQRLFAINKDDGQGIWTFATLGRAFTTPAVADGVVYVGITSPKHTRLGRLHAVDIETGRKLWHVSTGETLDFAFAVDDKRIYDGVVASPTVVDGIVYFGSLDGKLYAVAAES